LCNRIEKMSVIKAICPKCDYSYYDWGLYNPIEYYCKECGSNLERSENYLADRIYDISVASLEHNIKRTRDLEITIGR